MEAAALAEEQEEQERTDAQIKEARARLDELVMQEEEPKDVFNLRIATEESKDSNDGGLRRSDLRKSNKKKRNRKSGAK